MDVDGLSNNRTMSMTIILMTSLMYSLFPIHTFALLLENEIPQLLENDVRLKGSIVGISVRSSKTGEIIYEHNGDIRLKPASNMKLITGAVALSILGENHTFETKLLTDGRTKGSTLKGNLYLVGQGDPTLQKEDFDNLALKLKERGISKVNGDLIGDDSWYDDVRLSQDMIWSDEEFYYGAQISALTASPNEDYDSGSVRIKVYPGREVGDEAEIQLSPFTDYLKVINKVSTAEPNEESNVNFTRNHGTNTVIIDGKIPLGSEGEKEYIAVWEPTKYALYLFQQSLKEHGIKLKGKIKTGHTPEKAAVITTHHSIPLSELLIPFMKLSNNTHAEILVKEIGKRVKDEGSWEKGLEVLTEQVVNFGMNKEVMVIRDGSGISHITLVPANELTQLLFHVQKEPWFQTFYDSLPVAGNKGRFVGGSLRERMATLDVRAKTGTIATVTSLSGYVNTKNGETLIFSILLNNLVDNDCKDIEDKIVEIMGNY